jgi:threonine dehydrogenase-like Zn-dependent dehydrogenase
MAGPMRALRIDGTGGSVTLVRDAAEPIPSPGDVLVRPTRVSLSPADLEPGRSGTGDGWTIGHEMVGVVERVEADPEWSPRVRERLAALRGRRVVVGKTIVCGQCDLCLRGLRTHCRNQTMLGAGGRDGAFADVLAAPAMNAVPVPDELDDERAVFAEVTAAALHAAQQLPLANKTYVTVLGDSVNALLCAQIMARRNASVRLVGADASRLGMCDQWGVKNRPIEEVGMRGDQDVVVECAGTPEGLSRAMDLVRPRGHVVLTRPFAAPAMAETPLATRPIVSRELTIIGSRTGSLSEALEALRTGAVDVTPLIGGRARLDDGPELLERARAVAPLKLLVEV